MRRSAPLVVAAFLLLCAPPARASGAGALVLDGAGWGHGVGMAQDGAYWMGRSGASTERILGHFFPGVGWGERRGMVRVVVRDGPPDVVLTFPGGGQIRSPRHGRQEPGFPVTVPRGGAVRIRHGAAYGVELLPRAGAAAAGPGVQVTPVSTTTSTTSTTAPVPALAPSTTTTTVPAPQSGASVWAVPATGTTVGLPARGARYRGVVQAQASGAGLRLVNELDVEAYLRGMGEVRDPSWPRASLRAQAVVARTYALRAMAANGEICDTQACQVYLGQQAEYPAMDRAVSNTASRVLLYRGELAATLYSASGGGMSATPEEAFGTPDERYPYLRAAPYPTRAPRPWQVRLSLAAAADRLGYPGALQAVSVTRTGPSGRPLVVALDGSAGRREVPARRVDDALGLRSTKWSARVETGTPGPPPVLPDRPAAATKAAVLDDGRSPRRTAEAAGNTTQPPSLLLLGIAGVLFAFAAARRTGFWYANRR
jgi:stage II sporulation protein D